VRPVGLRLGRRGGLVAMCVHGMVDAATWIVGRGAFVPWAVIGAILAVQRFCVRRAILDEAIEEP